ncbi:fatty acid desaturase family protein [Mycobacterium sp. JS623]|uniref:fatty acid desaturase family protein n=1 Tax=Mycobacterium sp. JS623 TaxID=212767 RepID=UPI0002EC6D4D|nr:fatty acid desaturase [Mycobacterium sp. JS623]
MTIAQVAEYAHMSRADVEALAVELDAIRRDIEDSRGSRDRTYITRTIALQRCLEVAARLTICRSKSNAGWVIGTTALAMAKCIENMEIGHNISHGQWDWMNDPEIHSTTWEWDLVGPSSHWRYSHNYRHHMFTNVVGMDDDLGYGVLRVTTDQPWKPTSLLQPFAAVLLAAVFEWGIALHGLYAQQNRTASPEKRSTHTRAMVRKMLRQTVKDYALFPMLSPQRRLRTLTANMAANVIRNVWAYAVIVCGHFPDGAQKFAPQALVGETKPEWYLRQMLGTANFDAGPLLAFMTGNLCYQIEHHLYPDLPSNRYAEISQRVQALCSTYDLPYTTGPLLRQHLRTVRTICKLALPDRAPTATSYSADRKASRPGGPRRRPLVRQRA